MYVLVFLISPKMWPVCGVFFSPFFEIHHLCAKDMSSPFLLLLPDFSKHPPELPSCPFNVLFCFCLHLKLFINIKALGKHHVPDAV